MRDRLVSVYPLIGGERVLPEVSLQRLHSFSGEVFLHNFAHFRIWRETIADGPIATVQKSVRAEAFPKTVEGVAIETQLKRCAIGDAAEDSGNFGIDRRAAGELAEGLLAGAEFEGQMIDHDSQARGAIG